MAKVGEGDERWIVKERADGQNCNNWHWTTKDVSGHTKKVRSGASSFAAPRAPAPALALARARAELELSR